MHAIRRYRFGVFTLVALLLTLSSFAADGPVVKLSFGDGAEVDVIVEFVERPLLERRKSHESLRAGSAALDAQAVQLEADLGRATRSRYKLAFAGASARVSREAVPGIRTLPYVKAVHLDREVKAHLSKSVPGIGAPAVWEQYGVRGKGIVVAVIDTGIDYNHKALGKGFGVGFKVIGGYDFVNADDDPMDDSGHGTHVAGIVAGNAAPVIGVAPEAKLLAYKVLDAEGRGKASHILAAVERAMDPNGDGDPSDRADVVNLSLGGTQTIDDPLVAAVERAVAAGMVVVASAGNLMNHGALSSPGIAPSVISVSATTSENQRAWFSSRGPVGGSWLAKPEIAAPGESIASAKLGGGTVSEGGTSMAAAHISGVAALLREKHRSWTPDEIKAAIVSTAQTVTGYEDPAQPRVLTAGGGRVDAKRAIDATILPSPATLTFGVVMNRGEAFTATRTVRLSNRGNASETLAIGMTGLPKGATLTVSPSTVTIPAGSTQEVTLTLALAKAQPEPNEDNIALTGMLELNGSRSALRVPWLAVNGGVLVMTFGGTEDFAFVPFIRGESQGVWQFGPRTWGVFAPEGIDVATLFDAPAGEPRSLVLRELLHVTGYTTQTISPEEAIYRVDAAGQDEHGVPFSLLAAPGGEATSTLTQDLVLRDYLIVSLPDSTGERSLRVGPFRTSTLRTFEVVAHKAKRYVTMYPPLYGVTRDERLEARDWASQTIEQRCKTKCTNYLLAGPGVGSFMEFPWYPLEPGSGTWKLFMTPRFESQWDYRAVVLVQEEGTPTQWSESNIYPWTYLSPALRNDGGRIKASPFGKISPADYVAPSADRPLVVTDGPSVLQTIMSKQRVEFAPVDAALGGTRGDDLLRLKAKLFDAGGNELFLEHRNDRYYLPRNSAGVLRVEVIDEYQIAGFAGRLTQTSLYDMDKHHAAPTLTMMRIEDAVGGATWTLPAGSRGRLFFAARQSSIEDSVYVFHQPIEMSGTKAWWRRHGTMDPWLPLPVSVIGTDYRFRGQLPGTAGTMYAGELQGLTGAMGAIDLKISVETRFGGTTETVYEPALVVTSPEQRRRAVR